MDADHLEAPHGGDIVKIQHTFAKASIGDTDEVAPRM